MSLQSPESSAALVMATGALSMAIAEGAAKNLGKAGDHMLNASDHMLNASKYAALATANEAKTAAAVEALNLAGALLVAPQNAEAEQQIHRLAQDDANHLEQCRGNLSDAGANMIQEAHRLAHLSGGGQSGTFNRIDQTTVEPTDQNQIARSGLFTRPR